MTLIVLTLVLCVLMYEPVTEACPSVCDCGSTFCNGTDVDCLRIGLTEVPTNIPTNTCLLWLEYNEITIIQTNIFNGLSNLQELSLSRNKISIIQSNAFNGLPNLQSLYIYNNSITVLDKDIFLGILKLEKLFVEGNPLHCDCIMADFVRFAQSKNLLLERWSEPTCSSPNNLTGVLLQDVSPEDMICDVTTATTPSKKISDRKGIP